MRVTLGNSVTVARQTLTLFVGVRIPIPQPMQNPFSVESGFLFYNVFLWCIVFLAAINMVLSGSFRPVCVKNLWNTYSITADFRLDGTKIFSLKTAPHLKYKRLCAVGYLFSAGILPYVKEKNARMCVRYCISDIFRCCKKL